MTYVITNEISQYFYYRTFTNMLLFKNKIVKDLVDRIFAVTKIYCPKNSKFGQWRKPFIDSRPGLLDLNIYMKFKSD